MSISRFVNHKNLQLKQSIVLDRRLADLSEFSLECVW